MENINLSWLPQGSWPKHQKFATPQDLGDLGMTFESNV